MSTPSGNAVVVTGPTSGMGRSMALALATRDHTVFLVGRDAAKLDALVKDIEAKGSRAIAVACDFADLATVTRAASDITTRVRSEGRRLVGLLNNAGVQQRVPTTNAAGWDLTFAVNHLAAFALTDALVPTFAPGAAVLFVASDTEDPDNALATRFGFRGARFLSVEACARGELAPGGSAVPGQDAYATSKLCNILTARGLANEIAPEKVRFFSFTPGLVPGTGLAREGGGLQVFAWRFILPIAATFMKGWSTPARAARVAARILSDASIANGAYLDDGGRPLAGSPLTRDDALAARVVNETRAFLARADR